MNNYSLAFIGTGHLGSALIRGLIHNDYPAQCIIVNNRTPEKATRLAHELGVSYTETSAQAAARAEALILAVKPQFMQELCKQIAPIVKKNKPLIISLAAVIEIQEMVSWLRVDDLEIVRVMTNTPIEFGKGTSALFANPHVTIQHQEWINTLFKTVGSTFWVDKEELLDRLTAAIGSAPAYVLLFMEALQKAALSQGIPEQLARKITEDLFSGTVTLSQKSGHSFTDLRHSVSTPRGVTEHSFKKISIDDFFHTFERMYDAVYERIEQIKAEK